MTIQNVWNPITNKWEYIDLSYVLGKTNTPDPRDGKTIEAFIHSFWVLCPLVRLSNGDTFTVDTEKITCKNCIAQLNLEDE